MTVTVPVQTNVRMEVRPLGSVASILVSNVDKLTQDDEIPVRLCNYTDVYKNAEVHPDLDLMEATATRSEIARFRLEVGDTVFTKDSETADDIGIPAFVTGAADDFICGYHLAIARPDTSKIHPKYLYWWLTSREAAEQWDVRAAGVTRVGLRQSDIRSFPLTVHTNIEDQRAITDFLDTETAQIDAMIQAQQKLVAELEERKAAMSTSIIWGATGADSGGQHVIDAAPRVPDHWQVLRNKWVYRESTELSETGDGEMLTVSHITGITPRSEKTVNMIEAESTVGYRVVRPNDLVINTLWGWMGALGVSSLEGIVSPAYGVYRPTTSATNPVFMHHLYRSLPYVCEIQRRSTGIWSSRLRLYPKVFLDMPTVLPPREEQDDIAVRLATAQARMDAMIGAANDSIALMEERRSALISAAVTGRIDPRTGQEYLRTEEVS